MSSVELHARRQRLWFNGQKSSELEVVPRSVWRRKRRVELGLRVIHPDPLCDADREELIHTIHRQEIPDFIEPPVLTIQELPPITLRRITRVVSDFYGVPVVDVVSVRRTGNVMRPRHVIYYLCRTLTTRSLPEIGRRLGGRDHTTILSGYRKIVRLLPIDEQLASDIEAIRALLTFCPTAVPIEG